jgi:hypothetical protein
MKGITMINQVQIEGFIVSNWEYQGEVFLRIAHHRPRRKGELIHSDYVTVRVAEQVEIDPELQQGDLVRVLGEVWGKDILEPLGRIMQKARLNVELTPELEGLIIPRPTSYVLASQVNLIDTKAEAYAVALKTAGRPFYPRTRKRRIPEEEAYQVT